MHTVHDQINKKMLKQEFKKKKETVGYEIRIDV